MADLKGFRRANKLTQDAVGEYLGVNKAFISRIEHGWNKLPEFQLSKLLNNDRGWDISPLVEAVELREQFSLRTDRVVENQGVPLYELDATAGLVSLFDQHTRQVPISHLHIPNLPPCDGALYVRGDSMYPLLKSGDIVLYKEVAGVESILWGEMYLLSFDIDGEQFITIKYIQRADADGYIRLVSHNPHHAPKDVRAESVRALALVKASVRFCTMG
jgi:transcriptional regulator with XRE-family HTH domain